MKEIQLLVRMNLMKRIWSRKINNCGKIHIVKKFYVDHNTLLGIYM